MKIGIYEMRRYRSRTGNRSVTFFAINLQHAINTATNHFGVKPDETYQLTTIVDTTLASANK